MKSLRQLYKVGVGPSSSHTMGPAKAARLFLNKHPDCTHFKVVLYGSLALTGKGHGTDRALRRVLGNCEVVFDTESPCVHPNTMDFYAIYSDTVDRMQVFSIGGGEIVIAGEIPAEHQEVYDLNTFKHIADYCRKHNMRLWQYAEQCEGKDIRNYMKNIWHVMLKNIEEGLSAEGELEGGLGVQRRAKRLLVVDANEDPQTTEDRLVSAYAFAVGEQNADGAEVVTAPTCGSCGVLPATFRYFQLQHGFDDETIVNGLLTAGIVGNIVKTNASISGAECGCQAEIGTACAMASAGLAEMCGMTIEQIEYAAEVALEHHLGLTCDPVNGLVQIPCIERNAVSAMRAINAMRLATFLADSRKITLDTVIMTMYETGKDLGEGYRETAKSGLAKLYKG